MSEYGSTHVGGFRNGRRRPFMDTWYAVALNPSRNFWTSGSTQDWNLTSTINQKLTPGTKCVPEKPIVLYCLGPQLIYIMNAEVQQNSMDGVFDGRKSAFELRMPTPCISLYWWLTANVKTNWTPAFNFAFTYTVCYQYYCTEKPFFTCPYEVRCPYRNKSAVSLQSYCALDSTISCQHCWRYLNCSPNRI